MGKLFMFFTGIWMVGQLFLGQTHAEKNYIKKNIKRASPLSYTLYKTRNFEIRCYKPGSWVSQESDGTNDKSEELMKDLQKRINTLMVYANKIKEKGEIASFRYKFSSKKNLQKNKIMLYLPSKKNENVIPKPPAKTELISFVKDQCYYVRKFRIRFDKMRQKKKRFADVILKNLKSLKESIFDDSVHKGGRKVSTILSTNSHFFLNFAPENRKKFEIMIDYKKD